MIGRMRETLETVGDNISVLGDGGIDLFFQGGWILCMYSETLLQDKKSTPARANDDSIHKECMGFLPTVIW